MYIRERLKSPKVYIGIVIGTIIVLSHFISDYFVIKPQLDGNVAFFTPYTRWIGYDTAAMTTFLLYFVAIVSLFDSQPAFLSRSKKWFYQACG